MGIILHIRVSGQNTSIQYVKDIKNNILRLFSLNAHSAKEVEIDFLLFFLLFHRRCYSLCCSSGCWCSAGCWCCTTTAASKAFEVLASGGDNFMDRFAFKILHQQASQLAVTFDTSNRENLFNVVHAGGFIASEDGQQIRSDVFHTHGFLTDKEKTESNYP